MTNETNNEYDAIIKEYNILHVHDKLVISGKIYDDQKGRFPDETFIRTSIVKTPIDEIKPNTVIQTLNTKYLLQ